VAADDPELETRWSRWLLERNRRGMRGVLWIVASLYPLFGILDYLMAPHEWLWLLYGTRVVVTTITIIMFRVAKSRPSGSSIRRTASSSSRKSAALVRNGNPVG
jgi:hypothetical protein